jgi:nucleoporin SEH1
MEFQRQSLYQQQGLISDISFDYYGKRFATSSTKSITIWTLDSKSQAWDCHELPSGQANNASKLSWAHPEFGQLIASSASDRFISIWEEQDIIARTAGSEHIKVDKWKLKATIIEKIGIHDVKFAPRIFGLLLGSACDDGLVRLYEPTDLFTLAFWELKESIPIVDSEDDSIGLSGGKSTKSLNCMCWSDSIPPRFAIGASGKAIIFVKSETKWTEECTLRTDIRATDIAWAPSMGRSFQFIATASREPSFQVLNYFYKLNLIVPTY